MVFILRILYFLIHEILNLAIGLLIIDLIQILRVFNGILKFLSKLTLLVKK